MTTLNYTTPTNKTLIITLDIIKELRSTKGYIVVNGKRYIEFNVSNYMRSNIELVNFIREHLNGGAWRMFVPKVPML